jgi:hypothetical protein
MRSIIIAIVSNKYASGGKLRVAFTARSKDWDTAKIERHIRERWSSEEGILSAANREGVRVMSFMVIPDDGKPRPF